MIRPRARSTAPLALLLLLVPGCRLVPSLEETSLTLRTPGKERSVWNDGDRLHTRTAWGDHERRVVVHGVPPEAHSDLLYELLDLDVHGERALLADVGTHIEVFDSRFDDLPAELDAWTTVGGRYDGQAVWSAEDGVLTGRTGPNGEGGLLYTPTSYASFELELETLIDYPFDSGVFVRMVPEAKGAQVTLDHRPGGEIGGVYSEGWLAHQPGGAQHFRRGEWNHVFVRCTGADLHLEAWINGKKTTDHRLPPDAAGYATTGLVGLQVHGGEPGQNRACFRNVRIRRLPLFGERPDGAWDELIDDGLTRWEAHGQQEGYRVEDGVLSFPIEGGGELATTEDYRDFRLQLEFQISKMANSGVFLRAARDGSNPAYSGCEVQILDDFHWEEVTGSTLKPWQFSGSLYGAVAPRVADALRPPGEWNTTEILYRGSRLAVALNGILLYDVDTSTLVPEQGPPFAGRAPAGFIGLQHHSPAQVEGDASIRFRNVRVQRL